MSTRRRRDARRRNWVVVNHLSMPVLRFEQFSVYGRDRYKWFRSKPRRWR